MEHIFLGEAAVRLGLKEYQLRKACDDGVIDVPRAGRLRLFPVDRLDGYRGLLCDAGLLRGAGLLPSSGDPTLPDLALNPFPIAFADDGGE